MKVTRPSPRSVVMGLGLILVGALLVAPVGAHVKKEFGHLWKKHIKPKLAAPGTINKAKNPVNWTKLKHVPSGFADGTDDVAGGAGGGDITSVGAGSGLSGGGDSGDVSLGADFSAIQARVSDDCIPPPAIPNPSDPDFGSSIRAIKADGTVTCTKDDVGPKGVEVVSESTPKDSSGLKEVSVQCPPPKIEISGGAHIMGNLGPPDGVTLLGSHLQGALHPRWFASAHEAVPTSKDWSLFVQAVCVLP
ncbi:MAG: hypothetical protein M3214_09705 [Actinomycetota bacterium]|nr:hypothetical protein [Actinomycetota bacterium]